ncbi:1819_t:CDS:1, partial [Dentiscutata heterogama]
AALNFLETQKNSASVSLSVRRVVLNFELAEQILHNAIAQCGASKHP